MWGFVLELKEPILTKAGIQITSAINNPVAAAKGIVRTNNQLVVFHDLSGTRMLVLFAPNDVPQALAGPIALPLREHLHDYYRNALHQFYTNIMLHEEADDIDRKTNAALNQVTNLPGLDRAFALSEAAITLTPH